MSAAWSQDSSVGIVTHLIPSRGNIFLSSTASRPAVGPTQPHIQWIPRAILPWGGKQLGCRNDHSPTSSAEDKNGGAIPPLPHMSLWHGA
jgi:hypothetical protein